MPYTQLRVRRKPSLSAWEWAAVGFLLAIATAVGLAFVATAGAAGVMLVYTGFAGMYGWPDMTWRAAYGIAVGCMALWAVFRFR